MDKPQVEIIREGESQYIFIDGWMVPACVGYTVTSGLDNHPDAELTVTILCQIKERENADTA